MSSINQSVVISGAIMPADASGTSTNANSGHIEQPRQPTSLQGLLKFAMDARKNEEIRDAKDAENAKILPIDDQRKKFLEDALKSMTVDIIEVLQNCVKLLLNSDKLAENADETEYLTALETILDSVGMIDTAIDFHKIGGFMIFHPCLASKKPRIRALSLEILAECCQNNPYCQDIIVNSDILELLTSLLEKDADITIKIKSLYAISCTIRENDLAILKFVQLEGLKILKSTLKIPETTLVLKCAFLLTNLSNNKNIRDSLVAMGTIQAIYALIDQPRSNAHEHLLALLWALVHDNQSAIDACSEAELGLQSKLRTYLKTIEEQEELNEERQLCQLILASLGDAKTVDFCNER